MMKVCFRETNLVCGCIEQRDEKPGEQQRNCWDKLAMGTWEQITTEWKFAFEHAHRLTENRIISY